MLSDHCGELEIDSHCSQFVVVFKEGAVSRYQAISLQREKGNETRCHVAITYAFRLWCGVSTHAFIVACLCLSAYAFTMTATCMEYNICRF